MDEATFIPLYRAQVLDKLDPHKIIRDLGGDNFLMLCWEDPGVFCHRRVVAVWMEKATGIKVEELNPKLRSHQEWLRNLSAGTTVGASGPT